MATMTMILGSLLSALGLGAYLGTVERHFTALIPTYVGVPMLFLGAAARKDEHVEAVMHAATGLSLVGLLVSLQGLFLPHLFSETVECSEDHPQRQAVQAGTAVLTGIHFLLAMRSFIVARRK